MAGVNDLSGDASLPTGSGKLWIIPVVLELFAFPFAWISVQMLHDHEPWVAIAEYALIGTVLCITGVVWAVFRKRISERWPWHQLKVAKAELAKAGKENLALHTTLAELDSKITQLRSESLSIAINGKLVAGPAAFDEQRKLEAQTTLFAPLQLEALQLSKDILWFLEQLGKRPDPDPKDYSYDSAQGRHTDKDQLHAFYEERRK